MFGFVIKNIAWKMANRSIQSHDPKVQVYLPKELTLQSMSAIKNMAKTVAVINSLESGMVKLSDEQLKAKTQEFRSKIQQETHEAQEYIKKLEQELLQADFAKKQDIEDQLKQAKEHLKEATERVLDTILPEAFAVVREAGKRTVKMRHFDVQLIGGMVLHKGKIAEMATGEGKTLVATLAVYLNALPGRGVHIVTVNDYLARRDREWMGPIYELLGLTVGAIQHDMDSSSRQYAYGCDITYGTNNEFGFDYLRDNMVIYKKDMVQRELNFSVVDEVDSILVDEARTPLIISGPAEESTDKYYTANRIVDQLKGRRITEQEQLQAKQKDIDLTTGFDYIADEKAHTISLTDDGETKAAKLFGVESLHDLETIEYRHHVIQALRAREFFRRDTDYVVKEGEVIIVDEFTGRMMPGRRWSDGLHQAVEAKEGMKIARENQTLATVTFQNYFRMYNKLSGMTGTAYTEASEFKEIYKLDVVVIPTNQVLARTNHPDCIYKTEKEKFDAVVEEIAELHNQGRPMLVGTISIEKSERLSELLKLRGIPHQVLNAKYHELEAHIVSQAGRFKGVTIATNMAGRGTDIVLGGNPEFLAKNVVKKKELEVDSPEYKEEFNKLLSKFKAESDEEHDKVVQCGGLHVIGTERHEARRIDNQLRGRSGRQGDPGSSRFYVALNDDLMRLFGSDRIAFIMDKFGMEEGQVIEHPLVSRAIEIAQKRVEQHNFEIRKQLLEYDNVMNMQREVIYNLRRSILEGQDLKSYMLDNLEELVGMLLQRYVYTEADAQGPDSGGLKRELKSAFGLEFEMSEEQMIDIPKEQLKEKILEKLIGIYEEKEQSIGVDTMRHLERVTTLQIIDSKWKDHLYAMDSLREGISLRAYGQRDPLIEYKREGFSMFETMFDSIKDESVETIFKVQTAHKDRLRSIFMSVPQQLVHNEFSSLQNQKKQQPAAPAPVAPPSATSPSQPTNPSAKKVGRNEPCPCGSGKKYKKCCGK
ncbi:preprotein translocase subunit SecA [Candidatus Omnitrophota bacterium]